MEQGSIKSKLKNISFSVLAIPGYIIATGLSLYLGGWGIKITILVHEIINQSVIGPFLRWIF